MRNFQATQEDKNIAHYIDQMKKDNKITATIAQDFTSKNWYAYLNYKGQTFTQWGSTPEEAKKNLVIYMEKHELVKIKFNN